MGGAKQFIHKEVGGENLGPGVIGWDRGNEQTI